MAIDRIGKGATPTPEVGSGSVDRRGPAESFTVDRGDASKSIDKTAPADVSSPLARLRAGEIDVNGYVDLKVDEATKGLVGLSPAELQDIKKVLRDQMATDPALVDLVRTAAGSAATEPNDE